MQITIKCPHNCPQLPITTLTGVDICRRIDAGCVCTACLTQFQQKSGSVFLPPPPPPFSLSPSGCHASPRLQTVESQAGLQLGSTWFWGFAAAPLNCCWSLCPHGREGRPPPRVGLLGGPWRHRRRSRTSLCLQPAFDKLFPFLFAIFSSLLFT